MDPVALSAQLEAELMRELARCYDRINWTHFAEQLKRPVIVLAEAAHRLGQWSRATRTLELQRALVLGKPWAEVLAVLEHEMAHQFVDEVMQIRDESAHGDTFRRVCEQRGIDGRANGAPVVRDGMEGVDRTLERIRKLFALAGSSNQHEAEAAMKRAHELMLRHNIEQLPTVHEFEVRHLGEPRRRANTVEAEIMGLLSEFFFVEVISIPVYVPHTAAHGRVYEIAGTLANVEMASHAYAFLLATCERLWRENRADARVRSGRDRVSYQTGVIRGFREKLVFERVELRGVGLVWRGDKRLEEFYRKRNPRIVTRRRSLRVGGAHHAGREAGRTVVLHKPVTTGPSGGPKLLRG
ncbi:MAG TPA: DUF2786 domain-containing protein [Kofleriaceae bacterium]|nr:DUF2786 domain-containing protein [Kofleriaceae bacterium]